MKFGDYSPPLSPSLDQQRDALHKGLGRAMQWALNGRLDDEPLLAACLGDQRFDTQVEDARGDWLWRMIQVVGAKDRFRVPILHALHELSDERSALQLCQLATFFAQEGDETFCNRLYEIVEQKPFSTIPSLGEQELIELDGEKAFVFAARLRGRTLAIRDWEWDDERLIDLAVQRLGECRTIQLLDDSRDGEVGRFHKAWREEKKKKAERRPRPSHKKRFRVVPVNEIISAANSENGSFGLLRGWGMHADPSDLGTVLQHLWVAQNPKVIANFLKVFSNRALPEFDSRLIQLCQHRDEEVRRRAFGALEKNTHPLIRGFALNELQKGVCDGSVVGLFINNFQPGDERRILEMMQLPDNECELHWLLMDVIKILEKNPEVDCCHLAVITYAVTPCENCRYYAARVLHNQHVAPGWLTEECRYDSGEECRKLVGQSTESTEPV